MDTDEFTRRRDRCMETMLKQPDGIMWEMLAGTWTGLWLSATLVLYLLWHAALCLRDGEVLVALLGVGSASLFTAALLSVNRYLRTGTMGRNVG